MHYLQLPEKSGIYRATTPDGKTYIGKSKNIRDRARKHSVKERTGPSFSQAIELRGKDSIEWEVIEYILDPIVLTEREFFHINFNKSLGKCELNERQAKPFLLSKNGTDWVSCYSVKYAATLIDPTGEYSQNGLRIRLHEATRKGGLRMCSGWYVNTPVVEVLPIADASVALEAQRVGSDEWVRYASKKAFTDATGVNLNHPRKGTTDLFGGSRSKCNPAGEVYTVRFL